MRNSRCWKEYWLSTVRFASPSVPILAPKSPPPVITACSWVEKRQRAWALFLHKSALNALEWNTDTAWNGRDERAYALPLAFSDNTVVRLPKGASSRAKQSGWMLIPIKETTHGCCKEWSMLASWRNSEKFFMASIALRCLSMVSKWKK